MGRGTVFKAFTLLAPIIAVSTAGCVTTPPLSQATGSERSDIMIKDVVLRVKCELSNSFDEKIEQPEFAWLGAWTAHADLSLAVNDNVGFSPNGSFTDFRRSAINTEAGKVSGGSTATFPVVQQFFSVAVGANLSGQAVRTETVSFTIGLDELQAWRKALNQREASLPPERRTCNFPPSMGVTGNLGLKEWVDSAFYPVVVDELNAGIHKADWKTFDIPNVWGPKPFNFDASLRQSLEVQRLEAPSPEFKSRALKRNEAAAVEQKESNLKPNEYENLKDWQGKLKNLQAAIRESATSIAQSSEKIRTNALTVIQKLRDNKKYKEVLPVAVKQKYNVVGNKMEELITKVEKCNSYKTNIDISLAYLYRYAPTFEPDCLQAESTNVSDSGYVKIPAYCPVPEKKIYTDLEKQGGGDQEGLLRNRRRRLRNAACAARRLCQRVCERNSRPGRSPDRLRVTLPSVCGEHRGERHA